MRGVHAPSAEKQLAPALGETTSKIGFLDLSRRARLRFGQGFVLQIHEHLADAIV
jgi:hypothetical protein